MTQDFVEILSFLRLGTNSNAFLLEDPQKPSTLEGMK